MRYFSTCRCVFVLFLFATKAPAQVRATVNDQLTERVFFLKELPCWIDTTNHFTIDQVAAPSFSGNFTVNNRYQNADFLKGMSYWIRLDLHVEAHAGNGHLIEFFDQTIDRIDAYVPTQAGGFEKVSMGDNLPFAERTFHHKNFEIPVAVPEADTTLTWFFRVQSHDFADIRIALKSVDRFIYYALNEYFVYGTFYGMILIISLYNLLVYLAIREIKHLYYIWYMLSVALYTLSLDGIGFQYLWPAHPGWNEYAGGISLYLVILFAIIFTRRFLSTSYNAPKLDRVLKWTIVARTVIFALEFLFFPQFFSYRIIEIVPLSIIFYTGIQVWRNGYRPARFFVAAYGILFLGFFVRTLVYFNMLPFTIILHYSLHISFVLEMLLLTFALGDRIRILKDMRDRALKRTILQHEVNMKLKDQVNRELEEKVKERTVALDQKNVELEAINQKLTTQAHEINQINSLLDLDNWKLKNSLKEVLNDRLLDKTMDYPQFRTLYPDELACFRFLENLKWADGYRCQKCGNEKYFDGAQKFARRCTRCGYNESITANTVFQGIKFPIQKGFYIAYLAVTAKDNHTLGTLAEELSMRLNTVWSFRNKVNASLASLEKKGKRPHASRWEDVLLTHDIDTPSRRGLSATTGKFS